MFVIASGLNGPLPSRPARSGRSGRRRARSACSKSRSCRAPRGRWRSSSCVLLPKTSSGWVPSGRIAHSVWPKSAPLSRYSERVQMIRPSRITDGRPLAQVGVRQRPDVAAVGVHAEQHERLRPPAEEAALAARRDEGQPAVGQRAGIVVVERPVGQLPQAAAVGLHRHQVVVGMLRPCPTAGRRSRSSGRRSRPSGRGRCPAPASNSMRRPWPRPAPSRPSCRGISSTQTPPPGRHCESKMSL